MVTLFGRTFGRDTVDVHVMSTDADGGLIADFFRDINAPALSSLLYCAIEMKEANSVLAYSAMVAYRANITWDSANYIFSTFIAPNSRWGINISGEDRNKLRRDMDVAPRNITPYPELFNDVLSLMRVDMKLNFFTPGRSTDGMAAFRVCSGSKALLKKYPRFNKPINHDDWLAVYDAVIDLRTEHLALKGMDRAV